MAFGAPPVTTVARCKSALAVRAATILRRAIVTIGNRIIDPAADRGLTPTRTVNAYPDLSRERALRDLAIERRARKAGARENSLQADDSFRVRHGDALSFLDRHWLPMSRTLAVVVGHATADVGAGRRNPLIPVRD